MVTVTHAKNVAIADDPKAAAAGEVLPSDWNAAHVVTGARTVLSANTNYYVTTTGSDSNDGSISHPWATIQHAMNVVTSTLDVAGFTVIINVGAGTFAGTGFAGGVGQGFVQIRGAGPSSTTIQNGPNDGVLNFGEAISSYLPLSWTFSIDGATFGLTSSVYAVIAFESPGGYLIVGTVTASASVGVTIALDLNSNVGFNLFNTCTVVTRGDTPFTITAPSLNAQTQSMWLLALGARVWDTGNWTITNTPNFVAAPFLYVGADCLYTSLSNNLTFTGSIQGETAVVVGGCVAVSSLPSGGVILADSASSVIVNNPIFTSSGPFSFAGAFSKSGLPATTDFGNGGYGAGLWGVFKDTSGGGVYLAYNDAGTIKKVALT